MPDAAKCPKCGRIVPSSDEPRLCPMCLMESGTAAGRLEPSEEDRSVLIGKAEATTDWSPSARADEPTSDGEGSRDELARGLLVRYFGDYEIECELGRGGMGVVYKAHQITLNRPVALKMIKAGVLADEADLRRFQNEAEALAALDHLGIVPVYEVGEHEGRRYFSMKLIEGGNLAERLVALRDRPGEGARLAAEAADAVHHAHMRGILHRDLKPANVLIDAEGRPHITDFGLAKRLEEAGEATQSGAILGTPAYMSPEQAQGRRGTITTATDVYGLGAILYAMLAGRAPFGGDSLVDTLDAVRNRRPDPIKRFNARTPRDLETICLKCLEKDPRRRYASAHDLARDLERWLTSRPITARRVGAFERAGLWCKRRPALAAATAAAALAVAGGASGVIITKTQANRLLERKNADLRALNIKLDGQRARAEERESQAVDAVKRFGDVVAGEPALKNGKELEALRKRLLREPLSFFQTLRGQLQADADSRPESLARLAQAGLDLGGLNREIGDKEDALRACEEAARVWEKLAAGDPQDAELANNLAVAYNNIAVIHSDLGRAEAAMAANAKAAKAWRSLVAKHPESYAYQHKLAGLEVNESSDLLNLGRPAEALAAAERGCRDLEGLSLARPAATELKTSLAKCRNNQASALAALGKREEALDALQKFRAIYKGLVADHPGEPDFERHLALADYNIGLQLLTFGATEQGVASLERSLPIRLKLVRAHSSNTQYLLDLANTQGMIGQIALETGDAEKALARLEQSRDSLERLTKADPSRSQYAYQLGKCWSRIGSALGRLGRTDQAMEAHQKSLAILEPYAKQLPDQPGFASEVGATLNNMAVLYNRQGRFEEARTKILPAIEWQRRALELRPNNREFRIFLSNHLTNLAAAAEGTGRTEEAQNARLELKRLAEADPAMKALDRNLAQVKQGRPPKDNAERLALAQRAYDKAMYALAARLWAEALEADPKLGDQPQTGHRYNCACSRALAAAGRSRGEDALADDARAKLRRGALEALAADLATWKTLAQSNPAAKPFIAQTLGHWREDGDLASVRDRDALDKLPQEERQDWQSLWTDVESVLAPARSAQPSAPASPAATAR